MSSESYRPITTIQEPGLTGLPRTYTSSREVAAETEAPARGSVLGGILGPAHASNIVLSAEIVPNDGRRILTVQHCAPPDWYLLKGSTERKGGDGEHIYISQVVPTPTQATIEADYLSTYEPIDETKSLRITKVPRRRKDDGTGYEDGYPQQQTKSVGVDNLTPQKLRGQTVTVETVTIETLAAADVDDIPAPTLPADPTDVTKIVHQKLNDDQYSITTTEEIIDVDADPLLGKQMVNHGMADTSEELVEEGAALPVIDYHTLDLSQNPLGNGKSVLSTTAVTSFPELEGQEYNQELGIVLPFTEQVVTAGTLTANSDVTPIDYLRSKRRTPDLSVIQDALDAIHYVLPSQESIQLPDVLLSAEVLVSRCKSDGNSAASGDFNLGGSSSVTVAADLVYELEEGFNGTVPSEIHVFFVPVSDDIGGAILTACDAVAWPIYRPKSHRVVMAGQGVSKKWSVNSTRSGYSMSQDADIRAFTNVGVIPASLHGEIDLTPTYTDYVAPTAELDAYTDTFINRMEAYWDNISALCVVGGTVLGMKITEDNIDTVQDYIDQMRSGVEFSADIPAEDLGVTVEPSTLSATNITGLTGGRHVVRSTATLYGYDRVKVTAVVVDTSELVVA